MSSLDAQTMRDLYELAREAGLPGRSKMSKSQLVAALQPLTEDTLFGPRAELADLFDDLEQPRPPTSPRGADPRQGWLGTEYMRERAGRRALRDEFDDLMRGQGNLADDIRSLVPEERAGRAADRAILANQGRAAMGDEFLRTGGVSQARNRLERRLTRPGARAVAKGLGKGVARVLPGAFAALGVADAADVLGLYGDDLQRDEAVMRRAEQGALFGAGARQQVERGQLARLTQEATAFRGASETMAGMEELLARVAMKRDTVAEAARIQTASLAQRYAEAGLL